MPVICKKSFLFKSAVFVCDEDFKAASIYEKAAKETVSTGEIDGSGLFL
jgi:hypothetical protein